MGGYFLSEYPGFGGSNKSITEYPIGPIIRRAPFEGAIPHSPIIKNTNRKLIFISFARNYIIKCTSITLNNEQATAK
jgi:hypothetical protein